MLLEVHTVYHTVSHYIPSFRLTYLTLSGLGVLSMKLLLVALEMGMAGIFFNKDEVSEVLQ